jgi:hypothetical protein
MVFGRRTGATATFATTVADLFAPFAATNQALSGLLLADSHSIGINDPAIKYS